MRRYRPFLLLGLAIVIASFTSSLVYKWLRAQAFAGQQLVQTKLETQSFAVAAYDLPRGVTITADMVAAVELPGEGLPEGHFAEDGADALVGRALLQDVKRNELILESKLAPVDGMGGVAAILDPAKRAMSVRVDDEVGVAGFVKPGDFVDVFVTIQREETNQVETKLVLAKTPVLAIGTEMVREGKDEEATPVKVITVEVSPNDAEKLALAATRGKFRLALRSPLSDDTVLTTGATVDSLLSSYREARVPTRSSEPGAARPSVQLIRGAEVSEVSF